MKYLVSIICILTFSCNNSIVEKTKENPKIDTEQSIDSILIKYTAHGCFGKCPKFKMTLSTNGNLEIYDSKNIDLSDNYVSKIDTGEVNKIVNKFDNIGFTNLENEYLLNISDLAKFSIIYKGKNISFHRRKAPSELWDLKKMLDELIFDEKE